MKNFTKILILSIFTILIIGGFAKSAFADDPTVVFENTPLFGANGTGELNFAPGSSVTRFIKITNNTDVAHRAIVRALVVNNSDKLGDAINLEIKQGDTILYNNTFSNFFSKSEVLLPQVKVGETNTVNFIATFIPGANNDYQNKTMNFSLQAGLEDVESSTDSTTTIGGGSSGSYITLGQKTLTISNEQALNISNVDSSGIVTITWNTNLSATSQVIYGPMPGPYNLNLTVLPNFGYPSGSTEDPNKVMNHSVTLSGLTPGATYVYRVVSRASPATVSYEHWFTVPLLTENNNPILNNNNLNNAGQVLGVQNNPLTLGTNNEGGLDTTQNVGNLNNQGGNLLGASAGNIMGLSNLSFWALLVALLLLIILIIKIIYRQRKKE